jgi:thiol-disulfide isomerase/thioredoxin
MKKLFTLIALWMLTIGLSHAAENTITLKTLEGKEIHIVGTEKGFTIPEYKGKILFVEFWGTHCPPCLMSIPHYIELQEKYRDSMAMLAIEVQNTSKEKLKVFAKAKGMNYDIVEYKDGYNFVEYITQRAGWTGSIPLLLILDQEGVVQIVQPGFVPKENLVKVIEDMIAKKKMPEKTMEQNSTK